MIRRFLDRVTDGLIFQPGKPSYGADYTHSRRQLIAVEGSVETLEGDVARVVVPCVLCPSAEPDAKHVVLHFHGTSGDIVRSDTWFKLSGHLRAHVINVEYPGYGIMPAGAIRPSDLHFPPSEHVILQVAELVFQHVVRVWGWPAEQVVLSGRSLGSGVATFLAKEHPEVAGLVLFSAYSSLQNVAVRKMAFLPSFVTRFIVSERFGSLFNVQQYHGPVMIAHGEKDSLISVDHAHTLRAKVGDKSKVTLVLDPQGTHRHVDCSTMLLNFMSGLVIRSWYRALVIPTARIADGGADSISHHAADLDAAKRRSAKHFGMVRRVRFASVFIVLVIGVYLLRRHSV